MAPKSIQDGSTIRQYANYHPSVWGDYFLKYISTDSDADNTADKEKLAELVSNVKKMLVIDEQNPAQILKVIDQIQRLGIAYKFESEIEEALEQIRKIYFEYGGGIINETEDLCTIALLFRLLRQQGYRISCDIFNKFKDNKGNFKEFIISDIEGMLSLYEASHLRIHGEDILEQALSFTTTHLTSMRSQLNPHIAKQVQHALDLSLRHGLTRLRAVQYMTTYESNTCHDEILILAKLDFNLLQKQHQKEIGEITRWWKELNFETKLPFARDRVVECYFWILGVYFEPEYSLARKMLTPVLALTSIIDDIYDVYGTMEELEMFTNAVERWSIQSMYDLPKYMQWCYKALLDLYGEFDKTLSQQGRSYRTHYAIQVMKDVVRGYMNEAKLLDQIPTMEVYMPIALLTSAYEMVAITSLLGMGDIVTQDAFEWMSTNPKMLKASTIVGRLTDDIVTRQREKQRKHVATAMDCFMNQYKVTEKEAENEFRKWVADAWKDINEGCLRPTAFPMAILNRILNQSCVINIIYTDDDHYSNSETKMKDYVKSLLIEPIPL